MKVVNDRMCAQVDGEAVLFLIGMRFNKLWKIHKWLPVLLAMPKMVRELEQNPDLGFLSTHLWFGRTAILVQYWRSIEQLNAYAKNRDRAHLPAWAAFNRAIGKSGDVGVWHETYRIKEGNYETIYVNMPPFGLGKATKSVPASGKRESAAGRMA
jgi:Monooxygenase af470-like